jgi:transcriptional regulator with XRE-family HTH domain
MGNNAIMARRSVPTDRRLRDLLRAGRRASGSLSQKTAAQRAGISSVYWQKIESGTQRTVPEDTLAMMLAAAGITAVRLRDEGYGGLASAVDDLGAAVIAPPAPEDYLAATPGASQEEVSALQAVWRALRTGRTTEPDEPDFRQHRRPRS